MKENNLIKVGMEAQSLISDKKTGIGYVAEYLIKGLNKYPYIECEMQYLKKNQLYEREIIKQYQLLGIKQNENRVLRHDWYKLLWPLFHIPYRLLFGEKSDITIFPNFIVPYGVKGKKIAIVHDMAYMTCPQTVQKVTRYWLKCLMKGSCKRADIIITVSEFSKSEILKYINVSEKKIEVIYNGVDKNKYNINISPNDIKVIKKKYDIGEEYFLYFGTLEPRKNIVNIIKAYKNFITNYNSGENMPELILAGKKGWMYDEIFQLIQELGLTKKVKHIGYVSEEDTVPLMKGARSFVFPSLYEGFGMPVLEAMACGVPVITSNSSSLKEIAGNAAILVNPLNIGEICDAFEKVYSEPGLSEKLINRGYEQINKFTWDNAIAQYVDIIKKMVQLDEKTME